MSAPTLAPWNVTAAAGGAWRKRNERAVYRACLRNGNHCREIGTEKGPAALVYPRRWDVYFDGAKVGTFRGHRRQKRARAWLRAMHRKPGAAL